MSPLGFEHSYARELSGAYIACRPNRVPAPRLLFLNEPLAEELGLAAAALRDDAAFFAGNELPDDAEPIAQAYAGHQFGGFSPQLGDGRALLLGELVDRRGRRRDIAFKGSGRTPFSRGGDGKAVVGPMLREALIGEAMHALGIPTTRALAVAATGEPVRREGPQPGAVLTRVAASHLRVGTFQFFAARGDRAMLQRLLDYTIARHDPGLAGSPEPALALLRAVAARQAELVAGWLLVGFIHGVMNTDNMALSGETIDYGPCAFIEAYDPQAVFSSIDHGGRYAYGNQPAVARWNLARFAETLLPLMADEDEEAAIAKAVAGATAVLDEFPARCDAALLRGRRAKLGITAATPADDAGDGELIADWLALLEAQAVDYTQAWRLLSDAADAGDAAETPQRRDEALLALFADAAAAARWLGRWRERCERDGGVAPAERARRMRQVNPRIIPRNHRVEEALAAASERGDLAPFERLLAALRRPYDDAIELAPYAEPAPREVTAGYRTYCGT